MNLLIKSILLLCAVKAIEFFFGNTLPGALLLGIILLIVASILIIISFALITQLKAFDRPCPSGHQLIRFNNIDVCYLWRLNGGGIILAHEFVRIVAKKWGKVNHVFEYCAGPGFIGFALLAHNLCDHLTLSDVNPEAIAAIKETIKRNNLGDRVTVYQSDALDNIAPHERFDLVVGNPPWELDGGKNVNIRVGDYKAQVHEKFFNGIGKFLKPESSILFVEGGEFTKPSRFTEMLTPNGLTLIDSFKRSSLANTARSRGAYKNTHWTVIVLLRLILSFREIYFILITKTPESK